MFEAESEPCRCQHSDGGELDEGETEPNLHGQLLHLVVLAARVGGDPACIMATNSWNYGRICCREPLPAGSRTLCGASSWSGWTRRSPRRARAWDSGMSWSSSSSASSMSCACCMYSRESTCLSQVHFLTSSHSNPSSYTIRHPSNCPLNGDRDFLPDGSLQLHLQLHLRGRAGFAGVENESP